MESQNKQKLQLIKEPDTTYNILVPREVEKKIRLLCREISSVEWSGVLFYKVEGNFEDNNLKIICVDLYQMDIGSSGYTEYTMSPDVATYMMDHNLMGYYQGHIHKV